MDTTIDAEYSEPNLAVANTTESPIAMPVVSNEQAKEAMQAYIEICEAVLTSDDYQEREQWDPKLKRRVKKRFKKKSAVKKLQTFFGITVKVRETIMDQMPEGNFGFRVKAGATKRNGDVIEAVGACSTLEERFTPEPKENESSHDYALRLKKARARAYHDVLSTAETRATNRAVMNAIGVGGGEVTAEEMPREDWSPRQHQKAVTQQKPPVDDHTVQLRYALSSFIACYPTTPKEEISAAVLDAIKGHFDLQEMPKKWGDVDAKHLKWAGDYFKQTKASFEAEAAVAA